MSDRERHSGAQTVEPVRTLPGVVVRTAGVAGVALAVAGAVGASVADAKITPGRGLAGAELDWSQAHVRRALGRPTSVAPPTWTYRHRHLQVSFGHDRRADSLVTSSRRERTSRRVGPGSTVAAVRRAYPKARCVEAAFGGAIRLCALTSRRSGQTVETDFVFEERVSRVEIYYLR
jgi:hypothetical protein